MTRDAIVILGIPINNLSMDETVQQILAMIDAYGEDGRARQVATVNVDFVVNTLAWRLSRIRHPELLDILRHADLVTPDGMPILWTSKLLGCPLKERVTGADLVPRLAEAAAVLGKSIYFLGGKKDVGKQAAMKLKEQYPDLTVAGIDAPFVRTEGEALASALEEDQAIVDRINQSGPDILLIGFGNPKQEIWFDRNRHRLQVPVSIGIGGTYEFIVGSVARAPEWMQKYGLEWIFRITQDPGRLWQRYFVGFFKFGLMIMPSVVYYRFKRLFFKITQRHAPIADIQRITPADSGTQPVKAVTLPEALDAANVEQYRKAIESDVSISKNSILDFSHVKFIDSSGLGFLLSLWRQSQNEKKNLFMTGLSSSIKRFLELNRSYELFKGQIYSSMDKVLNFIADKSQIPPFYYFEVVRNRTVTLYLFGTLDAGQMANLNFESIQNSIGNKDCIINLMDLTFVDSSGIVFFLKIQKHTSGNAKACLICELQDNVLQMFRITKLHRLFTICDSLASAEKVLKQTRSITTR